ncbi:MAG: hypothetical protein KA801_00260 [Syntrophorhabdaceae bacterium]|nr:hypothetical protein [Syntrophorhabdaceae bacterium]
MSLILHSYNDYDPDRIERDKFVKGEENPSGEGNWVRPYYDGSIAVGYGFDLLVRSTTEINSYLGKTNDALGLTGSQRISLPSSDIPLLAAAQNGNRKRTAARLSLALPSEAYSAKLTNILLNEFESALDTALGFCLVPSKEKTAILSLLYT